ncbi:hypothetical protein [Allorhodopirellula solitaria]|uniref:Uncharacterized protein n=1 Tax=Allorhodopirellula solitaria TaxID=2527987 RepID=A0A5C5XTM1_9BACT|nr:hypothetical protein [Allorhodopirellula solitaria]TWT65375.1 hypothetical protein CA85_32870 [Allorhodopirellula solitaria]
MTHIGNGNHLGSGLCVLLATVFAAVSGQACVADESDGISAQEHLDAQSLVKACQGHWNTLDRYDVLISIETTISHGGRKFPANRSRLRLRMDRAGKQCLYVAEKKTLPAEAGFAGGDDRWLSETIAVALTDDRRDAIFFPGRASTTKTNGFEAGLQGSLVPDLTCFGLSEFPVLYVHSNSLTKRLMECFGSDAILSTTASSESTTTITSKLGPDSGPTIRRWEIDNVNLRPLSHGVWHTYGMPQEFLQFKQSVQYGDDDRPKFLFEDQKMIMPDSIKSDGNGLIGDRSTLVEFLWLPSDSLAGTEKWGITSADTLEEISELLEAPE